MTELVGYILLFTGIGVAFIFVSLGMGFLLRPKRPGSDKAAIYECGEPTIGSSWVQFDLRFYVVALLFVIFDVEMAFFFPWAVVFGQGVQLADPGLAVESREALIQPWLVMPDARTRGAGPKDALPQQALSRSMEWGHGLAWMAFLDIVAFFGVLLVGFAYLWRRGDLEWVRSMANQSSNESQTTTLEREALTVLARD